MDSLFARVRPILSSFVLHVRYMRELVRRGVDIDYGIQSARLLSLASPVDHTNFLGGYTRKYPHLIRRVNALYWRDRLTLPKSRVKGEARYVIRKGNLEISAAQMKSFSKSDDFTRSHGTRKTMINPLAAQMEL